MAIMRPVRKSLGVYFLLHLALNPILSHGSPLAIDVQPISDEDDSTITHFLLERMAPKNKHPPSPPVAATPTKVTELAAYWETMKQEIDSGDLLHPNNIPNIEIIDADGTKVPLVQLDSANQYDGSNYPGNFMEVCKNFCFFRYPAFLHNLHLNTLFFF
jgi:hypothetical protein